MNDAQQNFDDFTNRINSFVKAKLDNYSTRHSSSKVIHDTVWGSIYFNTWEIQIIDSPLFQRLRDINQVGLASLTYPTARHSRFEHSLGTVAIVSKMLEKVREKNSRACGLEVVNYVNDDCVNKVRLAALVHDIGHCFYSHLSETVYGKMNEFRAIEKYFSDLYNGVKPKPHEILSYMIITSSAFRDFFSQKVDFPNRHTINMVDIGKMIIGVTINDSNGKDSYSFLTSLINGDFDADKLDYVRRDSHSAGLALTYDIERFLYKINIVRHPSGGRTDYKLVIDLNGITAAEELTFSKLMLFSYIYHHQKVLITESVAKDIIYALMAIRLIKHPCDFLEYTDRDIDSLCTKEVKPFPRYSSKYLKDFIKAIRDRNLPKRCFELNRRIMKIKNYDESKNRAKMMDECVEYIKTETDEEKVKQHLEYFAVNYSGIQADHQAKAMQLKEEIIAQYQNMDFKKYVECRHKFYLELCDLYESEGLTVDFDLFDIHIILPKSYNYTASQSSFIMFNNGDLEPLDSFMNLKDWGDSFNANKWRGYVYVSSKIDITKAFKVAQGLFVDSSIELKDAHMFVKNINYDSIKKYSEQ